ncbi:hypothetical protein [Halorussus pelagicus]|uniref:hypothetical protein n=1 Tax=Halorussus pelagicus TaxID=2505977 RepID=UPI000FFC2A11|nr:hypothetical protein [Halorussus pelagicus]
MTAVYAVFRPAYLLHEVMHYLAALLFAEDVEFGVTAQGRPWLDVEFAEEAAVWPQVVVGVAPVVTGGMFLAAYMWIVLSPLSGSGWFWLAPVHLYVLASAVVWATPSDRDLDPLRELL